MDDVNGLGDLKIDRRETLRKSLNELEKDYSTTYEQMLETLDNVEINKLQRKADRLSKRIDKLEAELKLLDMRPVEITDNTIKQDLAWLHRELQSKLPEIDFKELEITLLKIVNDQSKEGCAALLLFQQSSKMGGEWCAARIKDLLKGKRQVPFLHIPIEFQANDQAEAMMLLRRLGEHCGMNPVNPDLLEFARQVNRTLCGSLQTGSVMLIECRRCEYLLESPEVSHWMVKEFWSELLRELATVTNKFPKIKLILLLFVDGTLPSNAIADELRCTLEDYQKHKLLEIPLSTWNKDDIYNWIVDYSGLLGLENANLDRMTDKIFSATDGIPRLVVHELLKECCPSVGG